MMRKNQIKRLSLQKLQEYSKSTINGQMLMMVNDVIKQRNDVLVQKSNSLKIQIEKVRKQTKKTIKHMNEAVKDRLGKKEKIIMDKNSRPTHEDIKNLAELYNYIENQANLIDKNNKNIDKVFSEKESYLNKLSNSYENPQDKFEELDKEYERYYKQSEKQTAKLTERKQELSQFKSHIDNIHKTIEQYRIKYENVESIIRQRQRELDHLVTYFKNRKQQDFENIERQRRLSNVIETQLLKSQAIVNKDSTTNQQLQIIEIQGNLNKV